MDYMLSFLPERVAQVADAVITATGIVGGTGCLIYLLKSLYRDLRKEEP